MALDQAEDPRNLPGPRLQDGPQLTSWSTDACSPTPPFVTIIIVNYNGERFLDKCLAAVHAQTYPSDRREVIVVDNGSRDDSLSCLAKYPGVRLIAAERNWGFARGNNEAFRQSRGELIALLNNDTVADPRWLEASVEALAGDPTIGGMASKILLRDEPGIINSTGLTLYRDGRGGDRGYREPDRGQFDQTTEVFGGCGASVLLRRALLDDVGFFDERFFMYYEDLDLAWRAHLRGWRFAYAPRSVVHHVHCGTSGEWSPFFLYHVERNRVFVSLKNAPWLLAARSLAVFTARAARKWYRVLALRDRSARDRRQALAYVRAALSLVRHLPAMLWQRLRIRTLQRIAPDRAFAHLIATPPARASHS
jgi:GT2 family glycosyltransferase